MTRGSSRGRRGCNSHARTGPSPRWRTGAPPGSRPDRASFYHEAVHITRGSDAGDQVEAPERKDDEERSGSLLGEVSIVTLIVSAVVVVAIAGYALLLIVELFIR